MKKVAVAAVAFLLFPLAGIVASQESTEVASAADTPDAASPAAAVEPEPPALQRLAGSYTLVGGTAAAQGKIDDAINASVSSFGGIKQGTARKRLEAANKIIQRLRINSVKNTVTVGLDNYVVTAPLDGSAVAVTSPSGEKVNASFSLGRASLIQELAQSKGKRENTFRFNKSGELVMQVRETSPQLSTPVTYSLTYKRAGQ